MKIIESPSPSNAVKLHLLAGNKIGISHGRGVAYDADPNNAVDPNAKPPADSISALMTFLQGKLQPDDLSQAQTLIEQALTDTSSVGIPTAVGMDARLRARAQANKSFADRWGPNANRIRSV